MTPNQKNIFDALKAINDYNWQGYTEKTSLEWKFSLAIWGALVGIAVALLSSKVDRSPSFIWSFIFIGIIQGGFLIWIQMHLKPRRKAMKNIRDTMESMVFLGSSGKKAHENLSYLSPIIQIAITIALIIAIYSIKPENHQIKQAQNDLPTIAIQNTISTEDNPIRQINDSTNTLTGAQK